MEQAQKLIDLIVLFYIGEKEAEEAISIYNGIITSLKKETFEVNTLAMKVFPHIKFLCEDLGIKVEDFIKEMKVLNLEELEIDVY